MEENAGSIPLANYASLDPAPAEVVLERMAELSARADEKEGEFDDLHEQAETAWKERERHVASLMKLARARRNGKPLFMLKGGELIEEAPDTKAGPLFDGATAAAPAETPAEPAPAAEPAPVEEPTIVPLDAHPIGAEQPADGSVYAEASCPDGRTATIRADDGKWTGRIDGIPFAIDLPTARACADLIAKEFPDAALLWGWIPTEPTV